MKQVESIKENYEFKRVYKRGKSNADPVLAVYFFKNYKKHNRLGITVTSKIGKAVVRNKIRRRIKHAFNKHSVGLKQGFDFVVVARSKTPFVDYNAIEKSIEKNLKKLGMYDEKTTVKAD